jgi:hypothetical protein
VPQKPKRSWRGFSHPTVLYLGWRYHVRELGCIPQEDLPKRSQPQAQLQRFVRLDPNKTNPFVRRFFAFLASQASLFQVFTSKILVDFYDKKVL